MTNSSHPNRSSSRHDPTILSRGKAIRCAVYTRVSTDHGLEQEFNSLDAQREACAAYVKSQVHEGWTTIGDRYDDGGFSGGSLDRPALSQLLADIETGKIDTVVVYKIDRLTRSLTDFAKLVDLFEAHGVTFVSVTQSFNTTTSMGRLTLNVLLSFAQFEREVAGERIRDKVAASKKKGIWVGGVVPLGYRLENRKLVIDEAEAATVRMIFERYRDLGAMTPLLEELRQRAVTTRARTLASGKVIGGIPLAGGALGYLLKNRIYVGELNHKGRSYPGEHAAIIDRQLFEAVQSRLVENRVAAHHRQVSSDALLIGRIFDDRGNRMTPTHSNKRGARYRYYTSRAFCEGRREEAGSVTRVSAPDVEALVLDAIRPRHLASGDGEFDRSAISPEVASAGGPDMPIGDADSRDRSALASTVHRVVIKTGSIDVHLKQPGAAEPSGECRSIAWSKPPNRRRRGVVQPEHGGADDQRVLRANSRSAILNAIAKARTWLDELVAGKADGVEALAAREQRSERSIRMTLSLAFLAPDLVRGVVSGALPHGIGLSRLSELPNDWMEQHEQIGLLAGAPTDRKLGLLAE